jgi:hypothetical protein
MKLTKDEARILGEALESYKFEIANESITYKQIGVYEELTNLEKRLKLFGDDKRRNGRTSQDSFFDLIVRFCKANKK